MGKYGSIIPRTIRPVLCPSCGEPIVIFIPDAYIKMYCPHCRCWVELSKRKVFGKGGLR